MEQGILDHLAAAKVVLDKIDDLREITDKIAHSMENSGKLFLIGNGGSAADAQHIAAELVGRLKTAHRPALPAIALTTDTSILTAVSNDSDFDQVFVRQLEALATYKDVVWALSVSGSSPNILKGLEAAREIGCTNIGFTGLLGEELEGYCPYSFVVAHKSSDRVQEIHQLAYHLICEGLDTYFSSKR